jgi:hypothetical protein
VMRIADEDVVSHVVGVRKNAGGAILSLSRWDDDRWMGEKISDANQAIHPAQTAGWKRVGVPGAIAPTGVSVLPESFCLRIIENAAAGFASEAAGFYVLF